MDKVLEKESSRGLRKIVDGRMDEAFMDWFSCRQLRAWVDWVLCGALQRDDGVFMWEYWEAVNDREVMAFHVS